MINIDVWVTLDQFMYFILMNNVDPIINWLIESYRYLHNHQAYVICLKLFLF